MICKASDNTGDCVKVLSLRSGRRRRRKRRKKTRMRNRKKRWRKKRRRWKRGRGSTGEERDCNLELTRLINVLQRREGSTGDINCVNHHLQCRISSL